MAEDFRNIPKGMTRVSRVCPECGERTLLDVPSDGFREWTTGTLVQKAFPTLTADEREILQTGIHSACWERLFGE